jgi:hypothetical protein
VQGEVQVSAAPQANELALREQDVQLEANAGKGLAHFRGFAGAIKTQLQWQRLQWTYLVKGALLCAAGAHCSWHMHGTLACKRI